MIKVKLTRSQKCWLGALGVGVVALVIDQCTGSSPPSAEIAAAAEVAATPAEAPAEPVRSAPAPTIDPATVTFDHRLAEQLARLDWATAVDGFTPSTQWIAAESSSASAGAVKVATFEQTHVLKAVIDGNRPAALVDNSLVSVGQAFDGFVLIEAAGMRATFCSGNVTARLVIDTSHKTN